LVEVINFAINIGMQR